MNPIAAAPQAVGTEGSWHTYTTADGLAGLYVEDIVEDREGCLWFATDSGGVSRFDGDVFRTFTTREGLASDLVYGMLCDRQGRVWCGSLDRGVCWYEDGAFHRFGEDAWVSSGEIFSLFEDDEGRIWFGGEGGVGWYDGSRLEDLTAAYQSCSPHLPWFGMAQDAGGDLWFGGQDLVRYDGARFQRCGADHGLPAQCGYSYAVARDGEGILWAARYKLVWRWVQGRFEPASLPPHGDVRRLQTDREGRLWVCHSGGVLVRDGGTFRAAGPRDGPGLEFVTGMFQTREGLFWFATWGGGVSCFDPEGLHGPAADGGVQAGDIRALIANGTAVHWAGLRRKAPDAESTLCLGTYGQDGLTVAGLEPALGSVCDPALAVDGKGGLWVGTRSGLYRCEGGDRHKVWPATADGEAQVTAIAVDAEGNLLLACRQPPGSELSIRRQEGSSFRTLLQRPSKPLTTITALAAVGDGGLWFGLGPEGAPQGPGQGIGWLGGDGQVTFWTAADGLVDNRVTDLLEDQAGDLWIATLGGLTRFDGRRFHNFTRADGLPTNHVQCLCADRRGRLWLGTDGALVVYDGTTFQAQWLPEVATIHDLIEDDGGMLWLATATGVLQYVPQDVAPRIRIQRVLADQVYENEEAVRLPATSSQIIFEYSGIGFRTRPREMLYSYRLEGYDEGWRPTTHERRVRYAALPVGEYRFEVKAIDRDLNESEPVGLPLTVEPDPRLEGLTEALRSTRHSEFVGTSPALRRALAQLRQVAATDTTVLIVGETGTGKGLAASMLHRWSGRRDKPLIHISCGALPEGLVESELFGHEKGAFTGAVRRKLGKVELAAGGMLFLDEIGDLPAPAQAKLLRLLEEGTFERVGGTERLTAEAQIVAATNRDLEQMVEAGTFRPDLFYRLWVVPVELPPLRERRGDIPVLAAYFLQQSAAHLGKPVRRLHPRAQDLLQEYPWPGNVRELEHVLQRAVIVCETDAIGVEDISLHRRGPNVEPVVPRPSPEEYERQFLRDALEQTGWVVKGPGGAAALLKMPESSLRFRLTRLGIQRP